MSYMSRLFPKSNSSYLLTTGKALQSEVVRLNKELFVLDTGLGNPKICLKDELTRVPSNPKVSRFNNKVGFEKMVAGETYSSKFMLERHFIDIMTGDLKTQARAMGRMHDLLGPCTDAVPGEPLMLLPMKYRQKLAKIELKKLQQKGGIVDGFVVNNFRGGGYAIAVAGYIGFYHVKSVRNFPRTMRTGKFHISNLDMKF